MPRVAFDSFEERSDSSWICTRATTIRGLGGDVAVTAGQVFGPQSIFAGHRDFAAYLRSHSCEAPPSTRAGGSTGGKTRTPAAP